MAFIHGKSAKGPVIDQYDLTSYFGEFAMNSKAGVAETTVFGKGAKTYISGIVEGTITGKGFFDAGAAANDQALTAALGRATNMAVSFGPAGSWGNGARVIVAFAAETDYSVVTPVANVIAVSFSAVADSGLATGVAANDPGLSIATVGAQNQSATTVAAGSNAVNTNTFTGAGILNVASTTGYQTAGGIIVATGTTPAYITYTGVSGGTQFTGCTTVLGGGVLATGGAVNAGLQDSAGSSTLGLVTNLHVISITGTGPTFTAKLQHSADGISWVDLTSFNGGSAITAVGAFSAFVAFNTVINKYLRAVTNTTGSTAVALSALITVARQ